MAPQKKKKIDRIAVHSSANDSPVVYSNSTHQMNVVPENSMLDESNMEAMDGLNSSNDQSCIRSASDGSSKVGHRLSNVWEFMQVRGNDKAKCNICEKILSRPNGGTSGLRKHLRQVHKLEMFSISSIKKRQKTSNLSIDEQKKLDLLIIKSIIEDGRSFGDMRRSGVMKLFEHLVPGK